MRRAKQEITDRAEIESIIARSDICHLALMDEESPYVLPLNFGYDYVDGALTLYFHCAAQGKKLDCIKRDHHAAFSLVGERSLAAAPAPCGYTMAYESVLGRGRIAVVTGLEERIHGLTRIMERCGWRGPVEFNPASLETVCLLRLTADRLTAKRNDPKTARP